MLILWEGEEQKKTVLFFFTYHHQRFKVIFFCGSYRQVMAYQGLVSIFWDVSPIWRNIFAIYLLYWPCQLSEPESGRLHSGHLLPVKVASHGWSISNIKSKDQVWRFWFLHSGHKSTLLGPEPFLLIQRTVLLYLSETDGRMDGQADGESLSSSRFCATQKLHPLITHPADRQNRPGVHAS